MLGHDGFTWNFVSLAWPRMVFLGALLERTLADAQLQPTVVNSVPADKERPQHTIYVLTMLCLAFASISVVSTLSTLYWFVKMRRGFRHE